MLLFQASIVINLKIVVPLIADYTFIGKNVDTAFYSSDNIELFRLNMFS